jgi:hypothetical protein
MSTTYKFEQEVKMKGSDRFASGGPVFLPIPPFPGLAVGALTVARVYVLQGPNRVNEIRYEDVDREHFDALLSIHKWKEME